MSLTTVGRGFLPILLSAALFAAPPGKKTRNVIFVMTDGLRWQEVFRGADSGLMNKELGGMEDSAALKKLYWSDDMGQRRLLLMPFLWTTIVKSGQIFGDRDKGSEAEVTNGLNFSYPGYSETLCGFADPRIDSNDKIPNPNETVLEWLNKKPAFANHVAAFGAWDDFPFIFNVERAGFPVNAGWDPFELLPGSETVAALNRLKADGPRVWDEEPFDAVPFYTALEYLKAKRPRILYVSFGETDDWAHDGNYAQYLGAAHRVDAYLETLWDTVQAMPEYRDSTTLVVTTDHGRGAYGNKWKTHGKDVPEAKYIWMFFMGPDTPPKGEVTAPSVVTQSQIAATVAALLGEDYTAAVPKAGKPIARVLAGAMVSP